MAAAMIPFKEETAMADYLPYDLDDVEDRFHFINQGRPTHIIRVVVRTMDSGEVCNYVDGTDVYMRIDKDKEEADIMIWEETWMEGPPKYHGGTVEHALSWVNQMNKPFYVQLRAPFGKYINDKW